MSDFAAPVASDARAAARPGRVTWARAAIAGWAVLGIALLFCGAMTRPVTYDEDQFIAAGVMARSLMPFRDFAYLQAPLYPLVLAPFFSLGHGWFLLTARLVSFGLAMCSSLLLWHLVRRLGAGLPLAVLLLTACLTSPFLITPLANSRNDGLPLTLLLAGLAAHLWAERQDRMAPGSWVLFAARLAAALLFGLATEAKVSYVFAPAVLLAHALLSPTRRVAPTLLGFAVAALPAVFFLVIAPVQFRFGLVDYHLTAPVSWYGGAGMSPLLTPWSRLQALGGYAVLGGNLALLVLAAMFSVIVTVRRRGWEGPGRMLIILTAGATACALLPAPTWAMYFAPVAPLLACCIAHLDRLATHLAGTVRKRMMMALAWLTIVPFLALQVGELPHLLDRGLWVGVDAHRNAEQIRAAMAAAGDPGGEVATLFPLWVIDANPVRPAFASGPFVFRSGDGYSPELLATLHALSPKTLEGAFDSDPPAAIYAGRYADMWQTPMDAALKAYAETHGWPLVRSDDAGGQLFVRPR